MLKPRGVINALLTFTDLMQKLSFSLSPKTVLNIKYTEKRGTKWRLDCFRPNNREKQGYYLRPKH